jgi:hypothetical protein
MDLYETPDSFAPPKRAAIKVGARNVMAGGDRDDHLVTRAMLGALKGSKSTPRPLSAETHADLAHRHALLLAVDMSVIDADASDAWTALSVAKVQLATLEREVELLEADLTDGAPITDLKVEAGSKGKTSKGKPAEPSTEQPAFSARDESDVRALVANFQRLVADLGRERAAINAAGARVEVLRNADRLAEQSAMNNMQHKLVLEHTMRQLSRTQGPDVLVIGGDAARGGSRVTYRQDHMPDPRSRHSRSLPEIRALRKPAQRDRSLASAQTLLKSHWDSAAVPRCISRSGLSASFVGKLCPAVWVSAGVGTDPAKLFEWQPEPELEAPSRRLRSTASAQALGHAEIGRDSSPLANRSFDSLSPLGLHAKHALASNSFATDSSRSEGSSSATRNPRRSLTSSASLPEIRRRT